MSANTANTPDGRGLLIFNGEVILVYASNVTLTVEKNINENFNGKYKGSVYLTSHRIIFMNETHDQWLHTFEMPFAVMDDVRLEQPIFSANYLKGYANCLPGAPIAGQIGWKLSFASGGCIDFGQALLNAVEMAQSLRPANAPPAYAPPSGNFFAADPSQYSQRSGDAFQAPTQSFPARPDPGNVFINEAPPPYTGIGSERPPQPTEELVPAGQTMAPPSYEESEGLRRRRV